MKACAITMVYRDYWALSQWYDHYAAALGAENLFIVAHGRDPRVFDLCTEASVMTVPRDDLSGFDRIRGQLLNGFQAGLCKVYDWVIRTDVDELVCLDPERHSGFADLFRAHRKQNALFALGLNVAEVDGDPELNDGDAVFERRKAAVFTGHYSKAFAVRRGVPLVRHGISVEPEKLDDAEFVMPQGVYLAHLKYASTAALIEANRHRAEIAGGSEKGLPGKAWRDAGKTARRFHKRLAGLPHLDWPEAERKAYRRISRDPIRDTKISVLRAESVEFEFRTELPNWFGKR